jgi:hypothetical protein
MSLYHSYGLKRREQPAAGLHLLKFFGLIVLFALLIGWKVAEGCR